MVKDLKKPAAAGAVLKKPSLKKPSSKLSPSPLANESLDLSATESSEVEMPPEVHSPSEEARCHAPTAFLNLWDSLTLEQKDYLRTADRLMRHRLLSGQMP